MDKNWPDSQCDSEGDWFKQYRKLIFHHIHKQFPCCQDRAEDFTAEVFKRVTRKLKGGGAPIENPKKYLIRTAEVVHIDYHRKKSNNIETVSIYYRTPEGEERSLLDDQECDEADQPEKVAEKRELLEEVRFHLRQLPDDQRHVLECLYYKEWSLARIAREIGLSREAV